MSCLTDSTGLRHCGLLASGTKTETIARIRELIAAVAPVQTAHQPQPPDSTAATDQATHPCPCCGGFVNNIVCLYTGFIPAIWPTPPNIHCRHGFSAISSPPPIQKT